MSILSELAERNKELEHTKQLLAWSQANNRIKSEITEKTNAIIFQLFNMRESEYPGNIKIEIELHLLKLFNLICKESELRENQP